MSLTKFGAKCRIDLLLSRLEAEYEAQIPLDLDHLNDDLHLIVEEMQLVTIVVPHLVEGKPYRIVLCDDEFRITPLTEK